MSKLEDLSGRRFNQLTAIKKTGARGNQTLWLCICDCGNTTEVGKNNLMRGHTKSCGCLKHQESKNKTHGKSKNRLYFVWRDMINRCYNANVSDYPNYGGRGITVCDEWKSDFQAFYDWAIANGYVPNAKRGECTLDRIDGNDNYCPLNCRIVNEKVQQNNRRNNVYIEYAGSIYTLAQLSEMSGIPYKTLYRRIRSLKWDIERAMNEKIQVANHRINDLENDAK